MQGTVKFFDNQKGFGFITSGADEREFFVHHTSIQADGYRELKDGERVEFDEEKTPKGWRAVNVRRVMTELANRA